MFREFQVQRPIRCFIIIYFSLKSALGPPVFCPFDVPSFNGQTVQKHVLYNSSNLLCREATLLRDPEIISNLMNAWIQS